MTRRVSLSPNGQVRALWLLAALILTAGLARVEAAYGAAIRTSQGDARELYARIAAGERTLSEQTALARAERAADADLERLAKDVPLAISTAGLLETLERNAAAAGVTVEGVEPQAAQAIAAPASQSLAPVNAGGPRLLQNDVLIRVSGRFDNLLRFVEALSHNRILIRVSGTDLVLSTAPGAQSGSRPVLDATVHATLYRLYVHPMEERRVASP